MRLAHRRYGHSASYLVAMAVLVIVALLVLFWPAQNLTPGGSDPSALYRGSKPAGPGVITGVQTRFLWQIDKPPPTTITIHNITVEPETCRVWWILSRVGIVDPWDYPKMLSIPVPVTLAASETVTVRTGSPEALVPQPGIYGMTVWSQCLDPATERWIPSDGATVGGNVETFLTAPELRRSSPNAGSIWVVAVVPSGGLVAGQPGAIRVEIANGVPDPVLLLVQCTLSAPTTEMPRGQGSVRSAIVRVSGVGTATTTVTLGIPHLPSAGHYKLSVSVREVEVSKSVLVDQVQLRHSVKVAA